MSQRSRPDGDVYTGGWSPTPLWEQLSEPPPPHDGTFIASPSLPPGRTFTVALDPLAAPIAGVPEDEVRPHELVVRLDGTGCGPRALVVLINTLHGEDRWIKSQLFDLGPGFQSYTLALSYREAARIEDYAALKVLVAASADLCPGEGGSSSSSSSGSLSVSTASSSLAPQPCNICPMSVAGRTITVHLSGCCFGSVVLTGLSTATVFVGSVPCVGGSVPARVGCIVSGSVRHWSIDITTGGGIGGSACELAATGDCGTVSCTMNVTCNGSPGTVTAVISDPIFCEYPPC